MKILLVKPAVQKETIGLKNVMLVEPLELEILGSVIPPEHDVKLIDCIIERKPLMHYVRKLRPDMVCFTAYITDVNTVINACREIKKNDPGIITATGGVHCEVCPGDFHSDAIDFRFVRNSLSAFPRLLAFLQGKESGIPAGVWTGREKEDKTALPEHDFAYAIPRRSLTTRYRKKYFYIFHDKVALLKTSFGCPFQCNFCFCRVITEGRYIQRPLVEAVAELKELREKEIYIVDDDFLTSRTRGEEFLAILEHEHIHKHYLIYSRADFIAHNGDFIRRFREKGLRTVIVGFESFTDKDLEGYNKGCSSDVNKQAMAVLNSAGVECFATVIVPPWWSSEDFSLNTRTLIELGLRYVNLQPLTPLPGTALSGQATIIRKEDYEKWDLAHVSVKPENMSARDFYAEILKMYQSILFQPKVLLKYLFTYKLRMLFKMWTGSLAVKQEYKRKMREAE